MRKRILLVAYACSPYIGSECTVGWHRAIETAKYFDTWVICDKRFENDIKRHLRNYGDIPGLKFCFVPRTRFEIWIWKIPPKLYRLGYNLWHRRVYRIAVRLHEELSFDIIHQVNWCGFREPGYLFVFTSMRDTSGNDIMEALSHGVPVICLNHQGAGDIVTDNCGIKIPVTIPHEVILGLRNAIVLIVKDRTKLRTLSQGDVERARNYLWSRNGELMNQIY